MALYDRRRGGQWQYMDERQWINREEHDSVPSKLSSLNLHIPDNIQHMCFSLLETTRQAELHATTFHFLLFTFAGFIAFVSVRTPPVRSFCRSSWPISPNIALVQSLFPFSC